MTTYSLVQDNENSTKSLTIILSDGTPVLVEGTHPNFDDLICGLMDNTLEDEEIVLLASPIKQVSEKLERLSERVSVRGNTIYFDGDEIHNAITNQICRLLSEDDDSWISLVNFLENIATNPSAHSREQLYNWLNARDFTITSDGMIVGYKGVNESGNPNSRYQSINYGPAIVSNVKHEDGPVLQDIDDVVEIPRSLVDSDPTIGCSHGLHVGTYEYASGWGRVVLEVLVHPRDVVSVPNDSEFAKIRVSRYRVINVCEQKIDSPVQDDYEWNDYEWDDHPHPLEADPRW